MKGTPAERALLKLLDEQAKPCQPPRLAVSMATEKRPVMKAPQKRLRPGELEKIQAAYAKGMMPEDIAYKLGRTVGSVRYIIATLRSAGKLAGRPRVKPAKRLAVYHTGGRG